ncbi:MAG: methylenetetrahydrofolate--tRNA-(uracil(54)-C(5))-methyltransferase (FADH(2)-oxidizing) TrmFO [Pseudomonadota bacterium]
MTSEVTIIGGGMAGSEAAWQLAEAGLSVVLKEMRPKTATFAHQTGDYAELVCSNSFRSDDHESNAVGLLHWEMRAANSIIMAKGHDHSLPAGSAMAVDRNGFSNAVTAALRSHPNIKHIAEEVSELPLAGPTILATGPLTTGPLAEAILACTGSDSLAFFDAIAPIVHADSVDMSKAWFQSRYDKGDTEEDRKAYLNCPMDEDQYNAFIDAILAAEKTEFKDWEKDTPYFDGCLPIEVMAERGRETLRFGPMKPVGLTNPHDPTLKPHAVVQLRRDNALGTLFNIVGFQTKMKYGEQGRVLSMIPGLEGAKFARLGGIHRNTFINSPTLLDDQMRLKLQPNIRVAGQITGVEGYVESAAMGLLAARLLIAELAGSDRPAPPNTTAMGALLSHISGGAEAKTFQPMNVNFGLFPPIDAKGGRRNRKDRYKAYTERAKADWTAWLNGGATLASVTTWQSTRTTSPAFTG